MFFTCMLLSNCMNQSSSCWPDQSIPIYWNPQVLLPRWRDSTSHFFRIKESQSTTFHSIFKFNVFTHQEYDAVQFGREAPASSVFSVERLASEDLVFQRKLCVLLLFLSLPVHTEAVKSPSFHYGSPFRFQTSVCRIHDERNGRMLRCLWNTSVLHRPYHSVNAPYSCICYRKYITVEVDSLILILIFLVILNVCTYYEAPQRAVVTWQCSL